MLTISCYRNMLAGKTVFVVILHNVVNGEYGDVWYRRFERDGVPVEGREAMEMLYGILSELLGY
jgi:hypothetical protein